MLKQKVFFFAMKAEGNDRMVEKDELRTMAADYVRIYGEASLADPETPAFVRQLLGRRAENELPKAG